ncbi:RES family NAD+ phosphorylase [Acidothermaceae bacterium B102]|nr:RES family NAD+ phosphorylase [Acidothermaceae bacterium B102]
MPASPAPHPKLPSAPSVEALHSLGTRDDDVLAVASHTVLWRIHATAGDHVVPWNQLRHFGPLDGRFDPHEPPPHEQPAGVLYLAIEVATCVAEVYQSTRVVNRQDRSPYLTGLRLGRTVRLLDLAGDWPTRAGASQAINSTGRRDVTRGWTRSIHQAFPALDGLWHPSSMHAGRPCVTLFETAQDALPDEAEVSIPLSHPALADALAKVADNLGYLLL